MANCGSCDTYGREHCPNHRSVLNALPPVDRGPLDIHGEPITCPWLYWSRSLAESQQLSLNGLICRKADGRYFAHEGIGWRRIHELPEDALDMWLIHTTPETLFPNKSNDDDNSSAS